MYLFDYQNKLKILIDAANVPCFSPKFFNFDVKAYPDFTFQ